MHTRRAKLRIHGTVQGVFFRESARREALRLGLVGWVRNGPDGTVQALAQGEAQALADFVDFCHHGPPTARVTEVEVQTMPPQDELSAFVVERSP